MAITVSATLLGTRQSIVRNSILTSAAGSIESLHILHGLGKSPDKIVPVLRSIVAIGASVNSQGCNLEVVSWDATVATVRLQTFAQARFDVLVERVHSIVA